MTYTSIATEKFAKKFDWWEQLYQVYYFAATSEQVMFDYNKVYSKKEIKKLVSDKDIINSLAICEKDDFTETEDEDGKYYIINLKKSYTYKELWDLIETDGSGYTVQMQSAEGKKIAKSNENTVESKTWISITIAKIVKNGAIPESTNINLEVK